MAKIIVSQLVKTSFGIIAEDANGKKIGAKTLLQAGDIEVAGNAYKINVVKARNGISSTFNPTDNDVSLDVNKKSTNDDFNAAFRISKVSKKKNKNKLKTSTSKYKLVLIHRKKNAKGIVKDYKYDLIENATGNEISLNRTDIENFFLNPTWDNVDKSKKLLAGKDALVSGLTEQYYAKDNTWHLRVGKDIPFVIDEDIEIIADNYIMTDVWARTILTSNGKHKLDKYGYTLQNERTQESEYYTRDQLFNIFEIKEAPMSSRYDTLRLKNATLQYYKSKSGAESWRVRPNETKVTWHIDESINTNTKDKYVCLKVYRVQVPSKNNKVQNQYVEFELAKLEDGELKDNTETFLVTGLDLVSLVEIPNAVEYPFYDSSRIDNLKIKNKKGITVYERDAEIEVYKPGKLPDSCESKIEPVIVDIDYDTWSKSHTEHANKIEKFIKAREDRAVHKVITWDEVVSQPLSDEEMNIVGITFEDFWENRFKCSCRLSTLSLTDESDTAFYDITPMETERKIPNTFVVKESRNDGSLRSVSVLKFLLDGEEPQDIKDALGHHWVRFLSCICNALDRRLVLVIGVLNKHRYAISCVDEMIQKKVLGGSSIYYLPFSWKETVNVTVKARNVSDAENLAKLKLNFINNLPEKREVVHETIKLDEGLAFELRSTKKTTIRPDDIDMSMEDDTMGTVSFKENKTEVVYAMPDLEIEEENIYLVTATLDFFGYMAIKAETEEEAFTSQLENILLGKIPFSGKGQLVPYSTVITSCDLVSGKEPGVYDKDWFSEALSQYVEQYGDKSVTQELVVLTEEAHNNWFIMRHVDGIVYAIDIEMPMEKYPVVFNIENNNIVSLMIDNIVIKKLNNSNDVNMLYDLSDEMTKNTVDNINTILGFVNNPIGIQSETSDENEFWDSLGGEEIVLNGLVVNQPTTDEEKEVDINTPINFSEIIDFKVDTSGISIFDIPLDMNKTLEFNNQRGLVKDLLNKLLLSELKVVDNNDNFVIPLSEIGHIEYYNKLKTLFKLDKSKSRYGESSKYSNFNLISKPMHMWIEYVDDENKFKLSYQISPTKFKGILTFNYFSDLDSDIIKSVVYADSLVQVLFTPNNVNAEISDLESFFVQKEEEDNLKYLQNFWSTRRPGEEFDVELANKLMTEEARQESLNKQIEAQAKDNDLAKEEIDGNKTLTNTVSNVGFKLKDADVKIPGTRPKLTVRELFDFYSEGGYDSVSKIFTLDYSLITSLINDDIKKRAIKQVLYPFDVAFTSLGISVCENINLEQKVLAKGLSISFSCQGEGIIDVTIGTHGANILSRNKLVTLVKEFVDKIYNVLTDLENHMKDYEVDSEGNYIVPSISKNMFLKSPAKFEVNEYEVIEPTGSEVDVLDKMYVDVYANFVLKNTDKKDFNGLILRQNRWKRKDILTLLEKEHLIDDNLEDPDVLIKEDNGFVIMRSVLLASKDNQSLNVNFITKVTKKPAKLKCFIDIDDMRWLTSVDKFVGNWVDYDTKIGNLLLSLVDAKIQNESLEIDWDGAEELEIGTEIKDEIPVKETEVLPLESEINQEPIVSNISEEPVVSDEVELDFGASEVNTDNDEDLDSLFDSLDTINVTNSNVQILSDADVDDLFDSSPEMVVNGSTVFNTEENSGLEDLEDLTAETVTIDIDMFKSIFNKLLNIIDTDYVSDSFDVNNNVITFTDIQKYDNTNSSINRLRELLINMNPVKVGTGYLKLLDSLSTKSVYDTILNHTTTIATLNKYITGLGDDFVNTSYKDDYLINAIASSDILTASLSDTGINASNFKFLNGVTRK